MRLYILLLLSLLAGSASAQLLPERVSFVTAFHGPPGGTGYLTVHEDRSGALIASPSWATNLRLLPIDFVGRTELEEFAPDRPRRHADLPGAARLVLQGGGGTLYHYERSLGGRSFFGFFRIGPEGRPRRLFELAGTGIAGGGDPFVGRIAVDPAGRGALIATTADAGGDLLEVDLIRGGVIDRTQGLAPRVFSDAGLWLADDWGLAVSDQGPLRFERGSNVDADFVPLPPGTGPFFSGQMVMSPGRTQALFTAGTGPTALHAFVVGRTGAARRLSQIAQALDGAGFLPEALHGPYMMVGDDGRLAAWRSIGPLSREIQMVRLGVANTPVEITGNAYFIDTLDEVGQLHGAFDPGKITLSVGELGAGGVIEKIDVFDAGFDAAGNPVLENRSLTSGDSTPRFDVPGTISPEQMYRLAGGELVLFDGKGDRLLGLDAGQSGIQVLQPDLKQLYGLERAGSDWLAAVRSSVGQKPGLLYRVSADLLTWTPLSGGGNNTAFADLTAADDGWLLLRAIVADTQHFVLRVDLYGNQVTNWASVPSSFQTPFGFSARGVGLFAEGPLGGPVLLRAWPISGGPFDLAASAGPGLILP